MLKKEYAGYGQLGGGTFAEVKYTKLAVPGWLWHQSRPFRTYFQKLSVLLRGDIYTLVVGERHERVVAVCANEAHKRFKLARAIIECDCTVVLEVEPPLRLYVLHPIESSAG